MDYDFQQIVGNISQVLIYFKIIGDERIGKKSYMKLVGRDLDGKVYDGLGVNDCGYTTRAVRVTITDAVTGEITYLLNDDGSYILNDNGEKIQT